MFAVVDVETTGFQASRNRLVEIAVVGMDRRGEIEWAWSSLINPQRDVGATHVHGVRARDVAQVPTFDRFAGRIAQLLSGRILVAHNAQFDVDHVEAEFTRAGYRVEIDNIDTLAIARALGIQPAKLADVCRYYQVQNPYPHQALGDAMATALVFQAMLKVIQFEMPTLFRWPAVPVQDIDGVPRPSKLEAERVQAKQAVKPSTDALSIQVRKSTDPETSYMAAAQRALEDRVLDGEEAAELQSLAAELELDDASIDELHRAVLASQAAIAWDDGIISPSEEEDLVDIATALGLPMTAVEEALNAPVHVPVHETRQLQPGDRVAFTGEMDKPRKEWQQLAETAGLTVTSTVSGKTTALIVADAATQSGKAKAARAKGVRVISEHSFARLLKDLELRERA